MTELEGKKANKSELEEMLLEQIRRRGLPEPMQEYKAVLETTGRKWAWDMAWVEQRLLVEVQGGTFMRKSHHSTGTGIHRDLLKANTAVELGWRLLSFDSPMVKSGEAVGTIERMLKGG